MTELFTPRAGFVKPQPGTGEEMLISKINGNFDKADDWIGAILVNDNATPSTAELLDGSIVKERTSGKVWVATKNGGGTFDKKWIVFPYWIQAHSDALSVPNGTSFNEFGFNQFDAGKNSDAGDLVSNRWVCPLSGVYDLKIRAYFADNSVGTRGIVFNFGGVDDTAGSWNTCNAAAQFRTTISAHRIARVNAGTTVVARLYQSSGGALSTYCGFEAALISVV